MVPPGTIPVLTGFEAQVDALASAKSMEEKAKADQESLRAGEVNPITQERAGGLEEIVEIWRNGLESDPVHPIFAKTVQVRGSLVNLKCSFTDSYSPIDVVTEPALRKMLGVHYDQLFEMVEKVEVKNPELLLKSIQSYAGTKTPLDVVQLEATFFKKTKFIKPVPNFREKRFRLRSYLSTEQNAALDSVISQIAARPSFSFK
jgi:hypothetical protein